MLGKASLPVSTRVAPLLPSRSSHGSGDYGLGQKAVHRRQSNQRQTRGWQAVLCFAACCVITWQLTDLFPWSGASTELQDVVASGVSGTALTANYQQHMSQVAQKADPANRLLYPVWWHAPFYTGTGTDPQLAQHQPCCRLLSSSS